MGNFRESYVKLDTLKKVTQAAAVKRVYNGGECAVYEFLTSVEDDGGEDAAVVFNVPLKLVFGNKYKWATFYRNDYRVVLTLVSNGVPTTVAEFPVEGELPYGNTHVNLQNDNSDDDDIDFVFSFSTSGGHVPTLLAEDINCRGRFALSSFVVFVAFSVSLAAVCHFCLCQCKELNWVNQIMKQSA